MHMGSGGRVRLCRGTIGKLGPERRAVLKRECHNSLLRFVDTLGHTDRWKLEPFTCHFFFGPLRNIAYFQVFPQIGHVSAQTTAVHHRLSWVIRRWRLALRHPNWWAKSLVRGDFSVATS